MISSDGFVTLKTLNNLGSVGTLQEFLDRWWLCRILWAGCGCEWLRGAERRSPRLSKLNPASNRFRSAAPTGHRRHRLHQSSQNWCHGAHSTRSKRRTHRKHIVPKPWNLELLSPTPHKLSRKISEGPGTGFHLAFGNTSFSSGSGSLRFFLAAVADESGSNVEL